MQRDLDKIENRASTNRMKHNKNKGLILTWEGATLDIHTDWRMGRWTAVPLKGVEGLGQQQIERESAVCPGSQEGQPSPGVH